LGQLTAGSRNNEEARSASTSRAKQMRGEASVSLGQLEWLDQKERPNLCECRQDPCNEVAFFAGTSSQG